MDPLEFRLGGSQFEARLLQWLARLQWLAPQPASRQAGLACSIWEQHCALAPQGTALTIDLLRVASQLRQQPPGCGIIHRHHTIATGSCHHRAACRAGVDGLDATLRVPWSTLSQGLIYEVNLLEQALIAALPRWQDTASLAPCQSCAAAGSPAAGMWQARLQRQALAAAHAACGPWTASCCNLSSPSQSRL